MYHPYHDDDVLSERVYTLEDNVKRFRKFGKVINRVAKNDIGETAKIGKIERNDEDTIYLIFYPDGEFDRFESGAKVVYRPGWTGPNLTTKRNDDDLTDMVLDVVEEFENAGRPVSRKRKILTDAQRAAKRARDRAYYARKKEKAEKQLRLGKRSASKSSKSSILH